MINYWRERTKELEQERNSLHATIRSMTSRFETADRVRAERAEARVKELEQEIERLKHQNEPWRLHPGELP